MTSVALSRSDSLWIRANREELSELPSSGQVWGWSSVAASHSTLCALRHRGLIESVDGGWCVDEQLYKRLQEL